MKKLILLILWLMFITGCQTQTTRYVHYHNERFGFEQFCFAFMALISNFAASILYKTKQ